MFNGWRLSVSLLLTQRFFEARVNTLKLFFHFCEKIEDSSILAGVRGGLILRLIYELHNLSPHGRASTLIYIDLARAKSEALDNIYSLLKQNIKSRDAKRRRQLRRAVENNNRSN